MIVKSISSLEGHLERLFGILIIGAAVTLPTKWILLNNILLLSLCGVMIIDRKRWKNLGKLPWKMVAALGSVYLLYALSLTYSSNLKDGFSALETRYTIIVLPLLFLFYKDLISKLFETIILMFSIACLSISVICLVTTFYKNFINGLPYDYNHSWQFSSYNLTAEWGFHPSYFSIYCCFVVFFLVKLTIESTIRRGWGFGLIIYLIVFQLFLASRVGILGLSIIAVVTVLYETNRARKLWIGVVSVVAGTIGIVVSLYSFGTMKDKINAMLNNNVNQYNQAFQLDTRRSEWRASLMIFDQHPILGTGIGDRRDDLNVLYAKLGCRECLVNKYDSHNLFLDTLATLGLTGFISIMITLIVSFLVAFKSRSIFYFQFLLLFLMLSMVEATFSVQKGIVFFAFMNSHFISTLQTRKTDISKKAS